MEILFLGTSSGVPTLHRNVSSTLLRLPQKPDIWMFDCGEGTQRQMMKSQWRMSQITKIFISHLHGDHVYGLPGLLCTLGLSGASLGIDLYGPIGLKQYLETIWEVGRTKLQYPLRIHEIQNSGFLCEEDSFKVSCLPLKHTVPCFGFRVEEPMLPGKLNVEKVKALGLAPGPLYAKIKEGQNVTLEDGRQICGKDYCDPPKTGRIVVYCLDTSFCESAVALSVGADLLIHEATYSLKEKENTLLRGHSTARDAGRVARLAGAKHLVLTHLSPRYMIGATVTPEDLLQEAMLEFENVSIAKDYSLFEVLSVEV